MKCYVVIDTAELHDGGTEVVEIKGVWLDLGQAYEQSRELDAEHEKDTGNFTQRYEVHECELKDYK